MPNSAVLVSRTRMVAARFRAGLPRRSSRKMASIENTHAPGKSRQYRG
jgi:hypothetical protein